MHDNKDEAYELRTPVSEMVDDTKPINGLKSGTARDAADMMRLGKKQEFRRNFHAFSMLGLSSVLYAQIHVISWNLVMLTQLKYGNMASIDRICKLQLDQRWSCRFHLVLHRDLDLYYHRYALSCRNEQYGTDLRGSIPL
jgi:hypothetical protein